MSDPDPIIITDGKGWGDVEPLVISDGKGWVKGKKKPTKSVDKCQPVSYTTEVALIHKNK